MILLEVMVVVLMTLLFQEIMHMWLIMGMDL